MECKDMGVLPDTIYYPFCGLVGPKYCDCKAGEGAFREWCRSAAVCHALQEKRRVEIKRAMEFSQIPKHWWKKTMLSFEGQEEIKLAVNRYLDCFQKMQEAGCGMYLWSEGSGRGKTHLLSAVCQEIIRRYAVSCIFMTEEHIFRKIRESFDDPGIGEEARIRQFLTIPCLFIDDFGATKTTAWKNEMMTAILDYRLNHALPTFFTSNFSLPSYESSLQSSSVARPGRITSRIYEMCRGFILEVKGEDFRRKLATPL